MFVAGTGSYAAEIAEYARDAGYEVEGLIELLDESRVGTQIHGFGVVSAGAVPGAGAQAVLAVGAQRLDAWRRLAEHGWSAIALVHPGAHLSSSAEVAAGAIVAPGVIVGARTSLGAHTLVGRGATIGHHVKVAAGAVINPGANVAGNVSLGEGASIGIGANVANGITISEGAVVAAGAVVVRDVAAGERVQGVPARAYSPEGAGG
jgi:sugar O-acyltransferase (sialic acid O-acetyltransferase NeuD family)